MARKMARKKTAKEKHFHKHRGVNILVLSIPVLIILFLIILATYHQRFTAVKEENVMLKEDLEQIQKELGVYRKAYEFVLADVKQLSQIYGGQARYTQLAADLLSQNKTGTSFEDYLSQNIINQSCLERVEVPEGVSQINFLARSSLEEPHLDLYVDAERIQPISIGTYSSFNVTFFTGAHEITLVSSTGAIELQEITFNNQTVNGTVDLGSGWTVFDCKGAVSGNTITEKGSYRLGVTV